MSEHNIRVRVQVILSGTELTDGFLGQGVFVCWGSCRGAVICVVAESPSAPVQSSGRCPHQLSGAWLSAVSVVSGFVFCVGPCLSLWLHGRIGPNNCCGPGSFLTAAQCYFNSQQHLRVFKDSRIFYSHYATQFRPGPFTEIQISVSPFSLLVSASYLFLCQSEFPSVLNCNICHY